MGHEFYYFLDDYYGYYQIEIALDDMEKTILHVLLAYLHLEGCNLGCLMYLQYFK